MGKTEFIVEPGQQDVVMTHEFDASPDVVFKAMTDPDLIPQWWGPSTTETIVAEMDVRSGGRWRFVHRSDDVEFVFWGVYHEVKENERVVQTTEFDGAPGLVALGTATLEESDGKTKFVSREVYPSVEARDAAVQSGMESGARETMERLAEIVEQR
jgi:uncharacterized protein YndB with AHSA1/START domain